MPRYHKLGDIPSKRHTVFKNKNGRFYYEELFGTIGFDGMSSLMYHTCLLYTSPSPRDAHESRMPSSA